MKKTQFFFSNNAITYKYLIILIPLLLIKTNGLSQSAYEKVLTNMQLLENTFTEKVHLHTDRSVFSIGEDIWFKAYLLEGTSNLLTSTSHNLHVEMISSGGQIIDRIVIFLTSGVGIGDFHLEEGKYKSGEYKLIAYTNFMRNFNKDIYFTKSIFIGEKQDEKEKLTNTVQKEVSLDFFPEGGNLIQNATNKVAFKATDNYGRGINVRIIVYDDDNNILQESVATHKGMGYTYLTPEEGRRYYAVIDAPGMEQKKFRLPDPIPGYSFTVGNQFENTLNLQINTSPEIVQEQQVKLLIQSRGMLFANQLVKIDKEYVVVSIQKDQMPGGISCITLYDENDIPVCERLIFNQLFKKVNIEVLPDKQVYGAREKVTLKIQTKDEDNNPVSSHLSLAVVDKFIGDMEKNIQSENPGILSSVLVNSDLKGKIENLPSYFNDFNRSKHYLLDLVLLTHGWRKYVWKEFVSQDTMTMDFDYERGFTFSGQINSVIFGKPLSGKKVDLTIIEDGFFHREDTTDHLGSFRFDNIYHMDSTTIIFQAFNKEDKRNAIIKLDQPNYIGPDTESFIRPAVAYASDHINDLAEQTERIQRVQDSLEGMRHIFLEEITVTEQKKEDDGHFRIYGEADAVLEVDERMVGYTDIFGLIMGRFAGVQVSGQCPGANVFIRGSTSLSDPIPAGYLLDGIFVEADMLCQVNVFDVDKVEVLKGPSASIFGFRGAGGIIAVYTKKGTNIQPVSDPGIEKIRRKGYYRTREFYSPDYDKPQDEFTGEDIRNTLHWEPFITTDANGTAQISFFNSDKITNYNITVEGVGLEGGLGQTSLEFQVSDN